MKWFKKRIFPNGPEEQLVIYRSGVTRDGRPISNKDVIEVYKNTQQYILPQGIEIPLKYGHEDKSQEYKGQITDVKLQKIGRKNTASYRYQIVATILFDDAAYQLFSGGAFLGLSAEIAIEGYKPDGFKYGQHVAGLALLGTEPAAIPGLLTARFANDPTTYYYSFVPGKKYINTKKEKPMETEKFQVPEDVMAALTTLTDFVSSLTAEEEPEQVDAEMDATDDNASAPPEEDFELLKLKKENEELKAALESKAEEKDIADQYALLHKAGKVGPNDKNIFSLLVKSAGMETAVKEYSARPTRKTPPVTPIATTELSKEKTTDNGWLKYKPKWEKHYSNMFPNDDKKLAEYTEHSAKQEFLMNGGKK